MMIKNIENNPNINEIISDFLFSNNDAAKIIGITGKTQGDKIEATPVKNEIYGTISTKIPPTTD